MSFERSDKKKLLKALGKLITLHRNIKGYTVDDLAIRCDMEQNQLLEIEAGRIDIRINNLLRIAYYLDIEMKNLLP